MNAVIHTLCWYLHSLAMEQPCLPLLGDEGGWLTAEQTEGFVEAGADLLYASGLRPGMPVLLSAGRTVNSVLALLCIQRVGAAAVLADPRQTPEQVLNSCAPPLEVPFYVKAGGSLRRPALLLTRTQDGACLNLPLASSGCTPAPAVDDPSAPAFYIFTSGSSGRKKAVILSQGNLVSNLLDSAPLGGYAEDDIALGALPLDHVFGLALLTGAIVLRHRLYLTAATAAEELLQVIAREKITRMNGVPSLYLALAKKARAGEARTLRTGYIGGAPWTAEQFRHIESALGMTLVPVYGMSECIGISCASSRAPQAERMAGVGPFYPANCGRIIREDGAQAAPGEEGEVCVRGPMRMLGYHDPAQTAQAVDGDGFLHTGDLGYVDGGGVLHLTGRKKDVIICNGVNLSPRRIEEALLSLPGVRGAVVVGLPDELQGERPWAAVCAGGTPARILDGLRALLPKNELPAGIIWVDALPMTGSGKPDKQAVKELIRQWRNA
ncbi:MAG: AMP-binding protein [Oscillospiraceae bacterium]|nr:AMP-binding protein [Oscillospiraceae bacterium]